MRSGGLGSKFYFLERVTASSHQTVLLHGSVRSVGSTLKKKRDRREPGS